MTINVKEYISQWHADSSTDPLTLEYINVPIRAIERLFAFVPKTPNCVHSYGFPVQYDGVEPEVLNDEQEQLCFYIDHRPLKEDGWAPQFMINIDDHPFTKYLKENCNTLYGYHGKGKVRTSRPPNSYQNEDGKWVKEEDVE